MPKIDEEEEQTLNITSMRDVKLTPEEKEKLYIMGAVILIVLGVAIAIAESISSSAALSALPNNCGNQGTIQGIYSCLGAYANQTHNTTVCYYMQGQQQQAGCIAGVALTANNVNVCKLLNSSYQYYSSCVLGLNKKLNSMALCGYLDTAQAFPCIYNLSVSTDFSTGYCYQLQSSDYKNACLNLDYYRAALNGTRTAYCAYLQDVPNATTLAFISYNATPNGPEANQNTTLLSTFNVTPQDYCYLRLALVTLNESICGNITGKFGADCAYYVEAANESTVIVNPNAINVSVACQSYSGNNRNMCYFYYFTKNAIAHVNVTECYMININYSRDLCVYQLALSTKNFSYCSIIVNTTMRSTCVIDGNYVT